MIYEYGEEEMEEKIGLSEDDEEDEVLSIDSMMMRMTTKGIWYTDHWQKSTMNIKMYVSLLKYK